MITGMEYIGNCINLFDERTGDCLAHIFNDVSHFAHYENAFWERVENDEDGFIDVADFNNIVGENDIVKEGWKCYFYPTGGKNIYVAYDPENDVHWFWA